MIMENKLKEGYYWITLVCDDDFEFKYIFEKNHIGYYNNFKKKGIKNELEWDAYIHGNRACELQYCNSEVVPLKKIPDFKGKPKKIKLKNGYYWITFKNDKRKKFIGYYNESLVRFGEAWFVITYGIYASDSYNDTKDIIPLGEVEKIGKNIHKYDYGNKK